MKFDQDLFINVTSIVDLKRYLNFQNQITLENSGRSINICEAYEWTDIQPQVDLNSNVYRSISYPVRR